MVAEDTEIVSDREVTRFVIETVSPHDVIVGIRPVSVNENPNAALDDEAKWAKALGQTGCTVRLLELKERIVTHLVSEETISSRKIS